MRETARGTMIDPEAIKRGQDVAASVEREKSQSHIDTPTPVTTGYVPDMSAVSVPVGATSPESTNTTKKSPQKPTPPKKSMNDHTKVVVGDKTDTKKSAPPKKSSEADEEI